MLGLLGGGDVVGNANEADMLAGRVPARLGFRTQPSPFSVGALVPGLQHERLERGFTCDLLLQDTLQVIRMQRLAPVEHDGLVERQAEEIEIGLVGERARAVELGDPDRHGCAVSDQPEALLALSQDFLGQHSVGNIDMGADQTQRAAVFVALDFRDDVDPSLLPVVRPHDPVSRLIVFAATRQRAEEMLDRLLAIFRMDAVDPILVQLIRRIGRQTMDDEVFG